MLDKINFNKTFNGYEFSQKKFRRCKIVFPPKNGVDVKDCWDKSRMHYLARIAIEYKTDRKRKKLELIRNIFKQWKKENPFAKSINWYNAMEVAIRAINLEITYEAIQEELNEEEKREWLKELIAHGVFIEHNLENKGKYRTNHYLSDLIGMLWLGYVFYNYDFGKRWYNFAKEELEKEIRIQFLEDGFDYEGSVNYHRLVTEIFLLAWIIVNKNNNKFSKEYEKRLKKAIVALDDFTFSSGENTNIGDTDSGRIIYIDWEYPLYMYNPLLTLAKATFPELEITPEKIKEETYLWQMFYEELPEIGKNEAKDKTIVKEYPIIGAVIVENKVRKSKLIFWTGSKEEKLSGHRHNDALNVILELNGKPLLIDPGSYRYTYEFKKRIKFVSEEMHNVPLGVKQRKWIGFFKNERNIEIKGYQISKKKRIIELRGIIEFKEKKIERIIAINDNFKKIEIKDNTKKNNWIIYKPQKSPKVAFEKKIKEEKIMISREYGILESLGVKVVNKGKVIILGGEYK